MKNLKNIKGYREVRYEKAEQFLGDIKMRKSVMGVLSVNGEVLFVRRQNFLNVFPGYTSFPGGKVDKTDISCSKNLQQFDEDQQLLKTLERELQEELKIDLSELVQNGIVQKVERLAKRHYSRV